jgi:hypothetical protein
LFVRAIYAFARWRQEREVQRERDHLVEVARRAHIGLASKDELRELAVAIRNGRGPYDEWGDHLGSARRIRRADGICTASQASLEEQARLGYTNCKLCGDDLETHARPES